MSENPTTYFPDVLVQWGMQFVKRHRTELIEYRSGREQRRAVFGATGFEVYSAKSDVLKQAIRALVYNHLDSMRGRYGAFYFWRPDPANYTNYAVGTVTAQSSIIVPFKGLWWAYGMNGVGMTAVAGSYSNVQVGGVSTTFTVTANIGTGGEDRINFTGGSQTGAVTVTGTSLRKRLTARYDMDEIPQTFLQDTVDVRAIFDIVIKELL